MLLLARIRQALQTRPQISLADLVRAFPVEKGLAELVAYLSIAAEDEAAVIDDSAKQTLEWTNETGVAPAGHAAAGDLQPLAEERVSTASRSPIFPAPLIALMGGIVDREDHPALWQRLIELRQRVAEYVAAPWGWS